MTPALLLLLAACGSPTPAEPPPEPVPDAFPLPPHLGVFGAYPQELSSSVALVAVESVPEPYFTDLLVLRTADAGRSWTSTLPDAEGTVVEWFAVDADHVWLVSQIERAGLTPQIRRSVDGGRTWEVLPTGIDGGSMARLDSLAFRDAEHGVVRHSAAGWLVTADGGQTWTVAGAALPAESAALATRASLDPGDVLRVRETETEVVVERHDPAGWVPVQAMTRYHPAAD